MSSQQITFSPSLAPERARVYQPRLQYRRRRRFLRAGRLKRNLAPVMDFKVKLLFSEQMSRRRRLVTAGVKMLSFCVSVYDNYSDCLILFFLNSSSFIFSVCAGGKRAGGGQCCVAIDFHVCHVNMLIRVACRAERK